MPFCTAIAKKIPVADSLPSLSTTYGHWSCKLFTSPFLIMYVSLHKRESIKYLYDFESAKQTRNWKKKKIFWMDVKRQLLRIYLQKGFPSSLLTRVLTRFNKRVWKSRELTLVYVYEVFVEKRKKVKIFCTQYGSLNTLLDQVKRL